MILAVNWNNLIIQLSHHILDFLSTSSTITNWVGHTIHRCNTWTTGISSREGSPPSFTLSTWGYKFTEFYSASSTATAAPKTRRWVKTGTAMSGSSRWSLRRSFTVTRTDQSSLERICRYRPVLAKTPDSGNMLAQWHKCVYIQIWAWERPSYHCMESNWRLGYLGRRQYTAVGKTSSKV